MASALERQGPYLERYLSIDRNEEWDFGLTLGSIVTSLPPDLRATYEKFEDTYLQVTRREEGAMYGMVMVPQDLHPILGKHPDAISLEFTPEQVSEYHKMFEGWGDKVQSQQWRGFSAILSHGAPFMIMHDGGAYVPTAKNSPSSLMRAALPFYTMAQSRQQPLYLHEEIKAAA